jgi:ABC-type Mn2+/Zn2+ transport system ATPase subunit
MTNHPPQNIDAPAHLEVENATVVYDGQPALREITFQVPQGARVAVVGANGAGKSTLFKALVGLMPLKSGRILIHGLPLGAHSACVAYVPQREDVDWHFPVTVEDVVLMGRYSRLGRLKRATRQDQEVVKRSLEQMGIAHLARHSIGELSGGQQQRVFLARALAQEPHLLLMDEPFTGVDVITQETTLALLDHLQTQRVTMMISTHDLSLAARHFDRVLLLNRQLIAYGPPAEVFTGPALAEAFGGRVLELSPNTLVVDDCCREEMK